MTVAPLPKGGRFALQPLASGSQPLIRSPFAVLLAHEVRQALQSARGRLKLFLLAGCFCVCWLALASARDWNVIDRAQAVWCTLVLVTVLSALMTISIGADSIAGERERGSLLPVLLTPVSRRTLIAAKLAATIGGWLAALTLSLPLLWAAGGKDLPVSSLLGTLVLAGSPVVLGFGFIAFAAGAWLNSTVKAMLVSVLALMLAAVPVFITSDSSGLAGGLAGIDPLYRAACAFRSIVIDKQSVLTQGPCAVSLAAFLGVTLLSALASVRTLSR